MGNNKISSNTTNTSNTIKTSNTNSQDKKSINITNKSGFYEKENTHIFSNTYLIIFVLVIALGFIGYTVYYYVKTSTDAVILDNSSYYGTNIMTYTPLFEETEKTIDDCINTCKLNVICGGITYDSNSKTCTGSKSNENGGDSKIRAENPNFSAWIKPTSFKLERSDIGKNFKKAIILGYTKTKEVIDSKQISSPYQIGKFCYSFNVIIYDFYKNFGSWRHLFHKGTEIKTGANLEYRSWENLILNYPDQAIGVWLAPFTNNLRIAFTTVRIENNSYGSFTHAFEEKCDSVSGKCYITDTPNSKWKDKNKLTDGSIEIQKLKKDIEYIDLDLQNIPLNNKINITVNFRSNYVDTLVNGKIRKTNETNGIPEFNTSSVYVMHDKTFGGEISNLFYYPDALLMNEIKTVISYGK